MLSNPLLLSISPVGPGHLHVFGVGPCLLDRVGQKSEA